MYRFKGTKVQKYVERNKLFAEKQQKLTCPTRCDILNSENYKEKWGEIRNVLFQEK